MVYDYKKIVSKNDKISKKKMIHDVVPCSLLILQLRVKKEHKTRKPNNLNTSTRYSRGGASAHAVGFFNLLFRRNVTEMFREFTVCV